MHRRGAHLACLFILFHLLSDIKSFPTDYHDKNVLHNCSSLFCSYDKLSNIYENSKIILTELENLLYDVRDEKNMHQSEHEYGKKLDLEIKFPNSKDYEDLSYLSPDEEYENESSYSEPVPYITISKMDEEDFEKAIMNDNQYERENLVRRPLTSEEELDVTFSRIHDLEEQQRRFKEEGR
ncbi:conserved Plasmodium protein, unknown function [Plasmodium ovale wallikeri]|uniref:PIR Superfamily Protein n=1 Tax=Plasmodium ovale wallikeri TaxID=864142 RepID=A0A1A8ZWE5_PLAOA|nr:conserved Plasmodium protein, unknown function [Plasmodium ovale wallikeri]SBT48902.1 conserved Plasmodium protein, unknown function [Plasmodium ovale wallikeri]